MGAEHDPFAIFTTPPPDETPAEREIRLRREVEEKRVSDRIDEEIKREKAMLKKQKDIVKVLLLGQSESGKSTTLKSAYTLPDIRLRIPSNFEIDFRMKYARTAWKAERLSWRAVVQLNLIRSVLIILDTLEAEMDGVPLTLMMQSPSAPQYLSHSSQASPSSSSPVHPSSSSHIPSPVNQTSPIEYISRDSVDSEYTLDQDTTGTRTPVAPLQFTEMHHLLKRRLGPLRGVEADLKRHLGAGTEEVVGGGGGILGEGLPVTSRKEFGINVMGWRSVLETLNGNSPAGEKGVVINEKQGADEATDVIAGCRDDMKALWGDAIVQGCLRKRRMRVEDSAGL